MHIFRYLNQGQAYPKNKTTTVISELRHHSYFIYFVSGLKTRISYFLKRNAGSDFLKPYTNQKSKSQHLNLFFVLYEIEKCRR